MFTVPGWNLSTTVATQVEQPKAKDPTKEGKKAKKRKRQQEDKIDGSNVGEYWDKVVQGNTSITSAEKPKPFTAAGQSQAEGDHAPVAEDGAQESRGKKRKRKSNKKGERLDSNNGTVPGLVTQDIDAGVKPAATNTTPPKNEPNPDKKKRKKEAKAGEPAGAATLLPKDMVSLLPPEPKGLTPLQKSMRQKLAGARFRHLNETLYTKPSADSLLLFEDDPSMFEDYHRGFAQQTESWPENPVDVYVATITTRGKARPPHAGRDKKRRDKNQGTAASETSASTALEKPSIKPLPRNLRGHCTIADLGCGTASLAYRLQPLLKSLNLTLHSFDLSKPSGPSGPLVTVADISALPVASGSVDVAIFCLALMGTNWLDFIDEAFRILRWRGELWVAEIKSRFGRVERNKAGKPPINSIGSLRKTGGLRGGGRKSSGPAEKQGAGDDGELGSDDEAELAHRIDGVEAKEGTDVSAFVDVLYKHGFVLDAPPEHASSAVDLGNKMFVKMQFVKAAQPTKGKNAKAVSETRGALKMGMKGKKFMAIASASANDDDDEERDAKVLKPCLYKIR